jgi:hypothetical protein
MYMPERTILEFVNLNGGHEPSHIILLNTFNSVFRAAVEALCLQKSNYKNFLLTFDPRSLVEINFVEVMV